MKKVGFIICSLLLGVLCLATVYTAPSISKDSQSILTNNASTWWDDRYGDAYLNACSFNQDSLITFNGWQYAAYYDQSRYVSVARRQLPNGPWQTITLADYRQTTNDNHNTISMGISPSDGRIHLAFDHHSSTLHYRMSSSGMATNPLGANWSASSFMNVQDNLGSGTITMFTYPGFVTAPNGTFLLKARIGTSGDGDSHLWRYNNTGSWTTLGKFLEGGNENAYFHGMVYDRNNRLHATWCWRATSSGYTNHDLLYAYSDDNGRTWQNNSGSTLATTGSDPIVTGKNFRVATIPQDGGLINQESMIIDAQGRVHVFSREDVNGTNYQIHYWRSTEGTWNRVNTSIRTKIWDNRSKIAYDRNGNVYGIMPNIRIASASASGNYTDWTVIDTSDDGRFHHSEPLIDPYNLLADTNELYIFAQQGTTDSISPNIYVIRYNLDSSSTPGPTPSPLPIDAYPIVHSVSSQPEIEHPASNILDGSLDAESRWSAQSYPQNIIIDYGITRSFNSTSVYTFENRDYRYRIELSGSPNSGYRTIVDRTSGTSTGFPIVDTFSPQPGRYIRITVTGAANFSGDWISLIEFEAGETVPASPTPGIEYTPGDVNGDTLVTIVDALMSAQHYVGLNVLGFNSSAADVNCDDMINIIDALMIAQYYVGLLDALACYC